MAILLGITILLDLKGLRRLNCQLLQVMVAKYLLKGPSQ